MKRLSFSYNEFELMLRSAQPSCFQPDPALNYENSLWDLAGSYCAPDGFFGFRTGQPAYAQVVGNLLVTRKSGNYIVKMILPMFVVVTLSTLTYWVDPKSPPARVGGSVTLVLSIVTFNGVVSGDLPKINYSTLLDWYVWKCFLFVVFAVAEYAFVNNVIVGQYFPERLAFLVDDFCGYTIPILWILSNLLFWPFLDDVGTGFVAFLEVAWFAFNIIRTWWNWKNEKKGMVGVKHFFSRVKVMYNNMSVRSGGGG